MNKQDLPVVDPTNFVVTSAFRLVTSAELANVLGSARGTHPEKIIEIRGTDGEIYTAFAMANGNNNFVAQAKYIARNEDLPANMFTNSSLVNRIKKWFR